MKSLLHSSTDALVPKSRLVFTNLVAVKSQLAHSGQCAFLGLTYLKHALLLTVDRLVIVAALQQTAHQFASHANRHSALDLFEESLVLLQKAAA